jgi:hypothetical protein
MQHRRGSSVRAPNLTVLTVNFGVKDANPKRPAFPLEEAQNRVEGWNLDGEMTLESLGTRRRYF